MPLTEDLGKAYTLYYTHASLRSVPTGLIRKSLKRMVQGYWSLKYGYSGSKPIASKALGLLLYFLPFRRSNADQDVRLLPAVANGKVLDVGCGSGDWLIEMKELGWSPEGVDFDEKAVKAAVDRSLDVKCGTLEQQNYTSNSYDAVTLNHVIEHIPDPVTSMKECFRVLKPGGQIVIFTPNAASASHQLFGKYWRGLEPPRHLHIFTRGALRKTLQQAGFSQISFYPVVARSVIAESLLIARDTAHPRTRPKSSPSLWLLTRVLLFIELAVVWVMPSKSDCVGVIAKKG